MNNLVKALVNSNEFGIDSKTINVDSVGELFPEWKSAVLKIRMLAYDIAAKRSMNKLAGEQETAPSNELFEGLSAALKLLGEVNGAPLRSNSDFAEKAISISSTVKAKAIVKGSQLDLYKSDLSKARTSLRKAKETNGVSEGYIQSKEDEVSRLEALVAEWEVMPKQKESREEIVSETTFMKSFAAIVANIINDRCAKSAEEVAREEAERKEKSKAASKAARQRKRQQAKAESK